MILMQELIKDKDFNDLDQNTQDNLKILLDKVNQIRTKWANPMIVTSGLRTPDEQIEIYKKKGITDLSKIPMKSNHLYGRAVDISDPNKLLQTWCVKNEVFLRNLGIWLEGFSYTPNWVHLQICPYASFKAGASLWFIP